MKIWSRIVGTIYVISGAVFSFLLLSFWANENFIENISSFLKKNIFAFGIAGLIITILGILWLVNWIDYIYRTKAVSFDNPGGKVKVSLKAIEDYITSMIAKQVQGIKSLKIKTSISSKGLETKIHLKLYSGLNIPDICANIQEITKNYLQDAVGIDRISNIEVFVTNIISGETFEKEYESEPAEVEEENERKE